MTSHSSAIDSQREWHHQRLATLQAADGWLTLIGLIWLDTGTHTVGTDPACAIRLKDEPDGQSSFPTHWGLLKIDGTTAHWTDHEGRTSVLQTDRNGTPTLIRHGPLSFILIERDGSLALRVRDEHALTRTAFRGIELFPFNPDLQFTAHWDGATALIKYQDGEYRLRPQNPTANPLHFVIADATSGKGSYGGGRFLHVPPAEDGVLPLDFNRLINPPCAFTPFAVCPMPPAENRLPFAILAGEKTYPHA
jgi:uncharacterized protein (DUF1684 family)